jgi:hypothetical protein
MTMTQKRWLEIPLLLMIIWTFQALELSLLHLPYYLGTPQLISLLVAYVAFSRGWTTTVVLGFALSFLGSSSVGYATGLYIAAHVWSGLASKTLVSGLTLEGRSAFVLLVVGYNIFLRSLTWMLLKLIGASPTLPLFLAQFFTQTLLMALAAWIVFPLFVKWDDFFAHTQDEESLGQQTLLR